MAATQGMTPFDFVENNVVFFDQGGVREESLSEGGLDVLDSFPVGGTEVSAERSPTWKNR